ncbi:MAG: FeoA family protein [Caldilineaceae bacterium]
MMTMITQFFQTAGTDLFAALRNRRKQEAPATLAPSLPLACSLARATIGQPLRLIVVRADHKVTHRLAELGLTPGVTLAVVQATGGPLLVAVRGARIAIGRELARQMEVAPLEPGDRETERLRD